MGVSGNDRDAMHDLRISYNRAKHEPTYDAPAQEIIDSLRAVHASLVEISKLRLGNTYQPSPKIMRRLLWFGAWDHYIGGDTEISIFLPCSVDVDIPWGFETIYVKMEEWEAITRELADVGNLCLGRACIPPKFYDFWNGEGEFRIAGTFEGDIRDMITVFARHERVEDLLPDLKRENEPYSMLAATLFATTDVARFGPIVDDSDALKEAIVIAAGARYAAPSTSTLLKKYSRVAGTLLSRIPSTLRLRLSGPVWVSSVRYAELEGESLVQSEELPLMVLHDGRLVVKL